MQNISQQPQQQLQQLPLALPQPLRPPLQLPLLRGPLKIRSYIVMVQVSHAAVFVLSTEEIIVASKVHYRQSLYTAKNSNLDAW